MDWRMSNRRQAWRNTWAVYTGDLFAAHRHGHGEGSVGQVGVVVFGQGEPDHPAGEDVQHRRQVQLALPGGDLGAVTEPLLVG